MLLNEENQKRVARAIAAIERDTDAELVTVLARQADDYRYIPMMWAGGAAVAAGAPGAGVHAGGAWTPWKPLLAQWTVLVVLAVLFRWPPLMMKLVPKRVKHWRAANLARRTFLDQGLHHTRGDHGVLIFVSEAEHYVGEFSPTAAWPSTCPMKPGRKSSTTFTTHVQQGEVLNGFLECIASCGDQLIIKVPATEKKNELPNHLVLL